jgi:hypothetical protein
MDRVAAQQKAFAEDPDLYERYRAAKTVRVGKGFVDGLKRFAPGAEHTSSALS